jgi:hypothetical protein
MESSFIEAIEAKGSEFDFCPSWERRIAEEPGKMGAFRVFALPGLLGVFKNSLPKWQNTEKPGHLTLPKRAEVELRGC